MKISYKTYPILKILEDCDFSHIKQDSRDLGGYEGMMLCVRKYFKKYFNEFKSNVSWISMPFINAMIPVRNQMADLYNDTSINTPEYIFKVSGTYIAFDEVVMIYREYNKDRKFFETAIFGFSKSGYPMFWFVDDGEMIINGEHLGVGGIGVLAALILKIKDPMRWLLEKVYDYCALEMFKRAKMVETKLLGKNDEVKGIDCIYKNETKLKVKYLTSLYFTTLVGEGFDVRGHFRKQPYKNEEGEWDLKIIWINPFHKEGYTRRAEKIIEQEKC